MKRRVLSVIIVLCMLFGLFPPINTIAEVTEASSSADMNALDALGIDTSAAPEGYDENDRSNPYGKDTVTLNPVGEFYTVGLRDIAATNSNMPKENTLRALIDTKTISDQELLGKLYGHDKWNITSSKVMMESPVNVAKLEGDSVITGTYKASAIVDTAPSALQSIDVVSTFGSDQIAITDVAAGNFDGNKDGLESQVAMIYTSKLDKNGGLYLKIGDIKGEFGSSSKILLSTVANIGNPQASLDGKIIENFSSDPYLMQNYLQITTGDYDGDGRDEIAVYIPEYGKSRIEVYKLRTITGTADYKTAGDWAIAWTYSLKETTYVSNMVSLVSGDFNSDGVDDIAATWGYYYGPNDNKGSTAVVLFGSSADGRMLQTSQEFPLIFGTSGIVRGSFAFGDITGGGQKTLILGGQLNSDLIAGNLNSRFIGFYIWDGSKFVQTQASNYDLFSKDDGKYIYSAMVRTPEVFYSSPLCVTNLAVIGQGLGVNAKLYLDSLQFVYGEEGLELQEALDIKNGNNKPYVEYNASTTDLIGLGKETLVTMRQTFSDVEVKEFSKIYTEPMTYTYFAYDYYYKNWFNKLFGIKTWYLVERSITINTQTTLTDTNSYYIPGEAQKVVLDINENYFHKEVVDVSTSVCVANTDNDTTYLNYEGKHFVYSDPEILAVLASPPFFKDLLGRDDLSGSYGESVTSYSTTEGSSSGLTANATISVGVYVSAEQEFSVFGIKAAKVEAETAITASFTYEYQKTKSLEQTVSYNAGVGEDMVAFYSIPLEVFVFNASVPDGLGGYKTQKMTVNIPHEASVKLIALDDYEAIAADYSILPQIADNVLTHTIGDPSSYPRSTNGYNVIAQYQGTPAGVGFSGSSGGGSITQEIAMSTETSNSFSGTLAIDRKVGAGAGGVTVGVTFGLEGGAGYVTTSTSGNSFSGEIQNMPIEAQEYSYAYNWKIFCYSHNDGSNEFPVVNYIVSNVIAPPSLPEDLHQDVSLSDHESIVLKWSYDKSVAGFQIYRYYDFPEGSGSYEIAFVSAITGVLGSDGRYHFSFKDDKLAPYTEYGYQIQTVRAAVPNNSIESEVYIARTKTLNGYPNINLTGESLENGILPIFPDTTSTVNAVVANPWDYPDGISYQWQMLTSTGWQNMSGQNKSSLSFVSSGLANQTQYRCRINVIYFDDNHGNTYYISAFSEPLSTVYSKRTAVLAEKGFKATTLGEDVSLSLSLISGHVNHNTVPTGNITFTINGVDYSSSVAGNLVEDGTQNGKTVSTATASIQGLDQGVYEVTAIYNGSRIFKTLSIDDPLTVLVGNASGYQLNLKRVETQTTGFNYGDIVIPVLNQVTLEGNEVTKTQIINDVTYELIDSSGTVVTSILTGNFDSPDVGTYTLNSKIGVNTVASRSFTVSPKPITVKVSDKTIGAGNVIGNEPVVSLSGDSAMAFDETFASLGLVYEARNSADNIIVLDNTTNPGNYRVTPIPGTSNEIWNYNITYESGTYTITAQTYLVTYEAIKYQNTLAGTIELTNSGNKFSSSVDLLFAAYPYNGFEVDTWTVIPVEDTGELTTDENRWTIQNGKSTLFYEMLDEPIYVKVTFKRSQLILNTIVQGGGEIVLPEFFTNGSVVTSGAEMIFKALPDVGYHFHKWEKVENNITTQLNGVQNDDKSNTLTFTMGNSNTRIYAYFERDSYILTLGENLKASYLYDDDGLSITPEIEKVIYSGALITGDTQITVIAKTGYQVVDDSLWVQIGSEAGLVSTDNTSYIFTITEDTEIMVDTQRQMYSLDILGENGELSVSLDDIGVSFENLSTVPGGSELSITATPDYGFRFDHWLINGAISTEIKPILTILEVGENMVIEAKFVALDSYDLTVLLDNPIRGSFSYQVVDPLNRTQIVNEITTPNAIGDVISVFQGDTVSLTIKPAANFMVGKWIINGVVLDSRQKNYTFENVASDTNVQVDMVPQSSHIVTFDTSILKATTDGVEFSSGDYVGGGTTIVFTPNHGIDEMIDRWIINSSTITNSYGKPLLTEEYIIDGLAGEVDAQALFISKLFHEVTINPVNIQYEATYEPMLDGKIRDGAAGIFKFKQEAGYRLDKTTLLGLGLFDSVSDPYELNIYTCIIEMIDRDLNLTIEAKKLHGIAFDNPVGGTIEISKNIAIEGEEITITTTPYSYYKLTSLKASYLDPSLVEVDIPIMDGKFTMPDAPVSIKANFAYQGGYIVIPPVITPSTFNVTVTAGKGGSISPGGGTIEKGKGMLIIITPDKGYKIEDVLVNGISKGNISQYDIVDISEDLVITASFIRGFEIPSMENWVNPFGDVEENMWYYDSVKFVSGMGLFKGTGDGIFSPFDKMTRGMLVTVLHRFDGVEEEFTGYFEDVDNTKWYSNGVFWAAENKIVTGYDDGSFRPDNNITREQLALILYRYTKFAGYDLGSYDDIDEFSDVESISSFAAESMKWAVSEGLITGKGNGILDPKGEASRAEVATILMRFIELLAN